MKKIILLISGLLFTLNVSFWALVSAYSAFNFYMTSASLVFTTVMLLWVTGNIFSDGYRIGGGLLILIFGALKFGLSLLSSPYFEDNITFLSVILISVVEIVIIYLSSVVTERRELEHE